MKKNYNQPKVETAEMLQGSIVMAGSPAAGIGAGTGGNTGNINNGNNDPIPGE